MGTQTPATAQGRALWALLLATLGTTASQPLGGDSVCTARPLAKYSITFTGKWSQTAFPKQYPLFRPPAQWSSLLGKRSPAPALGLSVQGGWHLAAAPHLTVWGHSNPIHLVPAMFARRLLHAGQWWPGLWGWWAGWQSQGRATEAVTSSVPRQHKATGCPH